MYSFLIYINILLFDPIYKSEVLIDTCALVECTPHSILSKIVSLNFDLKKNLWSREMNQS